MITTLDFIRRPFTPDLTQAGIAFACQWLARPDVYAKKPLEQLPLQIASVSADLALRHYLAELHVPFQTLNASPVSEPGRTDMVLGGRRLAILCQPLFHPRQIQLIQENPAALLDKKLPTPFELLQQDTLESHDLYLYAMVAAQLRRRPDEWSKTEAAGKQVSLLGIPPAKWRHPPVWRSLGKLILRAEMDEEMTVEIGGLGEKRQFLSERIRLVPGATASARQDFWSLAYLRSASPPRGRIAVRAVANQNTYILHPKSWRNIWMYGEEIIFAGYITRGEYQWRTKSQPEARGRLETRSLRSIRELLNQVRDWENR